MSNSVTPRARVRVSPAPALPESIDTEKAFYQVTMKPEKFIEFLTHPRQRDTDRHAASAKRNHLKEFNVTQANVSGAEFGGQFYKLDGHTRAMLWEKGELTKPDRVTATIYNCSSYEQLLSLYNTFDSKYAAENGADQLSGAMREAGIVVKSPMFAGYKFLSALKRAWSVANGTRSGHAERTSPEMLARQVAYFRKEIELLDSIDPNLRLFRLGVTAAAFITLKKRGESVLPFFVALNENRGSQKDGECDAVQALHNIIMTTNIGTHRDSYMIMAKTISCVENWVRGRTYTLNRTGVAGVKQTDIGEYAKSIAKPGLEGVVGADAAKTTARPRGSIERVLPATL